MNKYDTPIYKQTNDYTDFLRTWLCAFHQNSSIMPGPYFPIRTMSILAIRGIKYTKSRKRTFSSTTD